MDIGIVIMPYNILPVNFAQNFNGKTAKIGDEVVFLIKNGLYTEEGTEVLPESAKIVAEITNSALSTVSEESFFPVRYLNAPAIA